MASPDEPLANNDNAPASEYTTEWLRAKDRSSVAPYDRRVFGIAFRWWAWGPNAEVLVNFYRANLRGHHLDLGVGTGYLLDHANPPPEDLRGLTLLDAQPAPLAVTSERLNRYSPTTLLTDVREPWPVPDQCFSSVACANVLHTLPDPDGQGVPGKAAVIFDEALRVLRPGGRFFGCTVVHRDLLSTPLTPFGALMQEHYRRTGIFHNRHDSPAGIRDQLERRFVDVKVHVHGRTAFWVANRS